jgi:flagellar biogenesis protein FliO
MDARPLRRDVEPTAAPATGERAVRSPNATGWRTAAALGGVVGLILLLAWGYRAVASGGGRFSLSFRARRPGLIEVLSRTAISPRQSLCLVRIGPRLVLLGVSPDAVRALDVIQDADLAAQLVGQATQQRSDSSTAAFARCLEREARAYEPAADHVDETTVPEEQRLADLKQKLAGTIARLRAATVGP